MTINYEGGNRTVNKVISTVSSLGYDIKLKKFQEIITIKMMKKSKDQIILK